MLKAVSIEMTPNHPLAWPAGRQRPKQVILCVCVCVGGWLHYITLNTSEPRTLFTPQHLHVRACVVRKSIAYGAQARTANSNVFILNIKPTAAALPSPSSHPPQYTHHTHEYTLEHTGRRSSASHMYVC